MSEVDISRAEKAWRKHFAEEKRVKEGVRQFANAIFDRPKLHRLLEGLLNIAFCKGYEAAESEIVGYAEAELASLRQQLQRIQSRCEHPSWEEIPATPYVKCSVCELVEP